MTKTPAGPTPTQEDLEEADKLLTVIFEDEFPGFRRDSRDAVATELARVREGQEAKLTALKEQVRLYPATVERLTQEVAKLTEESAASEREALALHEEPAPKPETEKGCGEPIGFSGGMTVRCTRHTPCKKCDPRVAPEPTKDHASTWPEAGRIALRALEAMPHPVTVAWQVAAEHLRAALSAYERDASAPVEPHAVESGRLPGCTCGSDTLELGRDPDAWCKVH